MVAEPGIAGRVRGALRKIGLTCYRFNLALLCAAAVGAVFVVTWPSTFWPAAVPLGLFGVPAAVVDYADHRIPNPLTVLFASGEVAATVGTALVLGTPEIVLRALVGGVAWSGFLLVSFVFSGQPGPGDVKLAVPLGMLAGAAGWSALASTVLLCHLLAGAAALVLAFRRRKLRVPLAPAMVSGTVLAVTMTSLAA